MLERIYMRQLRINAEKDKREKIRRVLTRPFPSQKKVPFQW